MMVIAQNSSLPSELLSPQARAAVTRCVAAARASILLPNIRLNTALSIFSTKWPAARALLCHAVSMRDALSFEAAREQRRDQTPRLQKIGERIGRTSATLRAGYPRLGGAYAAA